ncbi:anti-sigma regulatory factor (Ser/Thr protein kinase) [Actinokineospora baliensis]|uniref:ATP-binding protein n=1 Tax=Actinokineospora baliensis TaxID=547056 RepID=UPI00195B8666|nr:ATP-binding protein [Actinokineospora baliensis]MBM7775806.1 anti-sigma regulatory factor (Ser/Thr protein kinase) [Actinokineospora baliensis]
MAGDVSEAAATGRVLKLSTRLPPATTSAGEAREFVGTALRSWSVAEELVCDVVLATSELVTNAIEHSTGDIRVELSLTGGRVLLRVGDDAEAGPVRKAPSLLSERSRGLTIVAAMSVAWGHEPDGDGKWVWAEFAQVGAEVGDQARGYVRESAGSLSGDN